MAVLHTYKKKSGTETRKLSPVRAIRNKCLDCTCWQPKEIEHCTIADCACYPFRMGKNPKTKKQGEQAA